VQLWHDPLDGLDPTDPGSGLDPGEAPWNWDLASSSYGGPTKNPPNAAPGWERWYFQYERPDGTIVQISADRDPQTRQWFNPHASSSYP
jgi:hypothetical protein